MLFGDPMRELLDQPLANIAAAVKAKQVTSKDITREFLDRIERVNPDLNAVVSHNGEQAMKLAAKADEELSQGTHHGLLHGIPMTIKDSLDTKDMVTTWGTDGRRDFRPGRDATCVARLRAAGAILLGKTNTPEFTLSFHTDNNLFGPTKNPVDLTRTPGGSRGGAAAIVAAGASLFDIGTDTGGSIRLPSHFSGVAGIKPTTGRVPCTGNALPCTGLIAPLSQAGPIARHTEDLEYLLNIIQGPDLLDPNCVDANHRPSDETDVSQLRIAYLTDNGIQRPADDIVQTINTIVTMLKDAGLSASEARPSGIEMTNFILSRLFSADGGELVEALLEDCRTTTPSAQIKANLDSPGLPIDQREFAQTINLWDNYRSTMLAFFEDFDVLLCPVNAKTALLLGEQENLADYTYTSAFNLTGWPAAVVRAGTSHQGLPIGIQIVARPFREDHCLAVGRWLEQQLGDFPRPDVYATKPN